MFFSSLRPTLYQTLKLIMPKLLNPEPCGATSRETRAPTEDHDVHLRNWQHLLVHPPTGTWAFVLFWGVFLRGL